ncbi:vancomycin high temperature exclusion protein [Lishizhenia sp.]|uniref:SanA/YdcF family protein n=1 Tax=Lishizhenia sp. TaxID=2497594 RepID=UPI00299F43B5|nr:ElyC/SanA/YdcF family protein [Lishizhenia sp.]MDX1445390.1 ElyC/SanA/YdcF family protein [Lishizhenia sp.]
MRTVLLDLTALFICIFISANILVEINAQNKNFYFSKSLSGTEYTTAVLLGCGKRGKTGLNPYYLYRVNAAAELYQKGKIKRILISGDNGRTEYSEPEDMRDDLIARGVPACAITLDYAGFRTFDSMYRAKEIFKLDKFLIISQNFHNERALFLANAMGIDAIAYNCKDLKANKSKFSFINVREYLARTKAFIDCYLIFKRPKFLGKEEKMSHC